MPPISLRALACAALVAVLPACSSFGGTPVPVGELYLTGVVAEVQHRATASGLLVDPPPGVGCGIRATADAETRVFRRAASGDLAALANAGAVSVGDRVEVYVDGPVAESCPVQGRASSLVVVG